MKITTETKTRLGYGIAFLLLLFAFISSIYTLNQLFSHISALSNTHEILDNLDALHLTINDMEPGSYYQDHDHPESLKKYYEDHFYTVDSLQDILKLKAAENVPFTKILPELSRTLQQFRRKVDTQIKRDRRPLRDTDSSTEEIYQRVIDKVEGISKKEKSVLAVQTGELYHISGPLKGFNVAILVIALLLAGYSWVSYHRENVARKKANAKTRRYAEELEEKVSKLKKMNKELVRLGSLEKFSSTGRIARMLAHEVRNPLTNINLCHDQLKDFVENEEDALELLDTVKRNSQRINKLVSELLEATREQDLKYQAVSINTLLDETLDVAMDRIKLKKIKLVTDYGQKICDVYIDKEKLKIAFLNIILNGVEAMEPEKGVLTIVTRTEEDKCVVRISDNGEGIAKDKLNKIFDAYYTGKAKGNGLGLTNTQNIIVNHKGSIDVESTPGEGTTFTVKLGFDAPDNKEEKK